MQLFRSKEDKILLQRYTPCIIGKSVKNSVENEKDEKKLK